MAAGVNSLTFLVKFECIIRSIVVTRATLPKTHWVFSIEMFRLLVALLLSTFIVAFEAKILFQRTVVPEKWTKLGRVPTEVQIDFRIALRQRNIDVLERTLLDTADPDSPNYGKWWTSDQILDLIAPEPEEVIPVIAWLHENGVRDIDASGRDFIKCSAPVRVVERLFQTEMYFYRHNPTGKIVKATFGSVRIPESLDAVVDLVTGINELIRPSPIRARTKKVSISLAQQHTDLSGRVAFNDVSLGYIVPWALRNMYKLPESFWVSNKASICVAEFEDDTSFSKSDLKLFNERMNEKTRVDKIVGPYDGSSPDAESTLDVQYASAIALNTTMWFWTVKGWMYDFATDLFKATSAPQIVSMSWGWPEPDQCQIPNTCTHGESSYEYVARTNVEFMKLGQKGITLLAASGDQGAPGDENPSCQGGKLSTIFPGASPWITSVGATMLVKSAESSVHLFPRANKPPICNDYKCATVTTEGVCTYPGSLITTGGGFSDYSPVPSWQAAATSAYLKSGVKLPDAKYFNASNRGFPDVSANGHAYLIAISGQFEQVDGTSCSSPVFAAVVALMNSYLMNHGKSPVGYVNPLLYKMWQTSPNVFTDITTGNNACTESCCVKQGFDATKGWDPVTGLGTPNWPNILAYLQKNIVEKDLQTTRKLSQ